MTELSTSTAAAHVAEITAALRAGVQVVNLSAYDSRLDGAEIVPGGICQDCGSLHDYHGPCSSCNGAGVEFALHLVPHDCRVTFSERCMEEAVLAMLVFAEEVLTSKVHVSDPVVLAEHCEDWRDEQHLRELVRYWSSRLAVEENEVSEHDLAEVAWGELGFADGALLLPQHQRAAKLRAAALLLLGVDDQLAEDAHERAQDALEEGR